MFCHKSRLPRRIEKALNDYKQLRLRGCLRISCNQCKHLVRIDTRRSTCENERLMKILLPKYRKQVDEIWQQTKEV